MNKIIIHISFLLITFFMLSRSVIAQAPDTLWTKTYGGDGIDYGNSVKQTVDSGYIITGRTMPLASGQIDVWLLKTNSLGDTMWTKTFGGTGWDEGLSVEQTSDSGYIICGYTNSFGSGDTDVWLLKTNSLGDTMWTKTYGGTDPESGKSVKQTLDGGYVITGSTGDYSSPNSYDLFLIRTDSIGNTIWTKTYGGDKNDQGESILQEVDGEYLICGMTDAPVGSYGNVWLLKLNSNGDTLWTKSFIENEQASCYAVQVTTDSGYIMTGLIGGETYKDVLLIKTNSSGATLWTKRFGGDPNTEDIGWDVTNSVDGGYTIAGRRETFGSRDCWIINTDSNGDTLWTKTIIRNGSDQCYSIQQTFDEGYILTGSTASDLWLLKLGPTVIGIQNDFSINPTSYNLQQNYPNPFNPTTVIKYQIPELGFVSLKVYDVLGKEMATLVNEEKPVGNYEFEFDATELPSGIYFYRLQAGSFVETKKMVLLR